MKHQTPEQQVMTKNLATNKPTIVKQSQTKPQKSEITSAYLQESENNVYYMTLVMVLSHRSSDKCAVAHKAIVSNHCAEACFRHVTSMVKPF